MFDLIGGAVAVFVATNLDGFVLLTFPFASPGAQGRTVVVGQYLGLAILVAISAIAAVGLVVVPTRWVGLLGSDLWRSAYAHSRKLTTARRKTRG
jgi:cadmium resistance protein CadD (predicted permease)